MRVWGMACSCFCLPLMTGKVFQKITAGLVLEYFSPWEIWFIAILSRKNQVNNYECSCFLGSEQRGKRWAKTHFLKELILLPGTPKIPRPVPADLVWAQLWTSTVLTAVRLCRYHISHHRMQCLHSGYQPTKFTSGKKQNSKYHSVISNELYFLPFANFNCLLFSLSCRIPCLSAASMRPAGQRIPHFISSIPSIVILNTSSAFIPFLLS